jgi:NADH-quinone oxidoreductase subunit A
MEITNSYLQFIENHIGIFIQALFALGFVITVMGLTHLIGPNRKTARKLENFECGIEVKGDARMPFSVKYFLTAILFVLFDVEIVFFYPWAVNFKELAATGFFKMLIFIAPLLFGFYYIIKKGALKWE